MSVPTREIDIIELAVRIERLCDFFLSKVETRDGSHDLKVLEDLKNDAADIQFGRARVITAQPFDGLYEYMKGV
jgi:hypothetical protein